MHAHDRTAQLFAVKRIHMLIINSCTGVTVIAATDPLTTPHSAITTESAQTSSVTIQSAPITMQLIATHSSNSEGKVG